MTDDDQSLLELFREEAAVQTRVLSDGLLALEHRPADAAALEACMRAAHSLKGAARIIGLQDGVDIAHVMEECFVGAQRGELQLTPAHIDVLLRGVDMLLRVGEAKPDAPVTRAHIDGFVARMASPESAARETANSDGPQPAPEVDVYAQLQAQLQAEALAQRQETPEADPTAPTDAPAQQDTHASARTPDC